MGKSIKQLFDTFSANLGFYYREYTGCFMCPLCLGVFTREQLSELSKAHIVAEGLGGTEYTLACKKCNSDIGAYIESIEIERARVIKAFTGKGNKPVTIQLEAFDSDGVVGCLDTKFITCDADETPRYYLDIINCMVNPKELNKIQEWIQEKVKSGSSDWGFRISGIECRDIYRANLSYLHAAYMLLFHNFGYEWIEEEAFELIRKQLRNPKQRIIPVRKIPWPSQGDDPQGLSINLITKPDDFQGFLAVIPMLEHHHSRVGVWLPLFGKPYDLPTETNGKMSLFMLPVLHDYLGEAEAKFRGQKIIADLLYKN